MASEPSIRLESGQVFFVTEAGTKVVLKKGYADHLMRIQNRVWDIEHFIFMNDDNKPMHVAVVVLTNGDAFVGRAKADNAGMDVYRRKRGHEIAIGKALKRALKGDIRWWHPVPTLKGLALRDRIREMLTSSGHWKKGTEN